MRDIARSQGSDMVAKRPGYHVRLSKNLSQLLRHGVIDAGLAHCLTPDGFVPLEQVLRLRRFKGVSVEDVRAIVAADEKGRFELRVGDGKAAASDTGTQDLPLYIRATQGHTLASGLDDDAMLTRLTIDSGIQEAVHGTSRVAWEHIRKVGLSRMTRRHVHMATALPGNDQVKSGIRMQCKVAVWVDVQRGIREGIPFFLSANDVVLSPGEKDTGIVPTRLFLRAHTLPLGEPLSLEEPGTHPAHK
ncbi:tRNA 2'-phosphotransferase 1 [Porphyridium purpureum]|uniref:2'-phosphotransferase n=1 Tax=Porphyridium purpureum TaxID=35688 RepID=A0A5J4YLP6_PORPP|nr:tRNA 2'-phosphotransferase 1 [Porphyridium purpureum]|eukprot:POR8694..scf249_10